MDQRVIWITWENQVRNKSLSNDIGARLFQLESKKPRILRYLHLTFLTFNLFRSTKARVVVVQNPSIVLALVSNIFSRMFFKRLAVDAHNGGLLPLDGRYRALNLLANFIIKISPLTIVSNEELKKYVERRGGKAVVVPDPLPELEYENGASSENSNEYRAVFVCTWARDEPYLEVVEAAKYLPDDVHIYITGNHKNRVILDQRITPNVHLTGFISDKEYVSLLNSSDVTIDLTTRDNCLVCGAYESVSLGKPMILSNKRALVTYFNKGALYTENTAKDIARKILDSRELNSELAEDVRVLKLEKMKEWRAVRESLLVSLKLS